MAMKAAIEADGTGADQFHDRQAWPCFDSVINSNPLPQTSIMDASITHAGGMIYYSPNIRLSTAIPTTC